MRKGTLPLWAGLGFALAILCIAATQNITIHFFTDAPNSVPVGSDFMLFQRNQSYVNSSVSQMKQDWFNNPVFSGNGGIQGVWTAVSFVGDGSQLTGINFSGSNSVISIITNVTFASSNIFTTNITVQAPGGFTNLNLTPKTVMYADVNDAESSIPNAAGVLTNDGSGGIGFSQSLSLSEVDAINFYPTNLFTGFTNAPLLSTDANGKLQNGSPLAATNVTFIAGANLTFTTNVDGSIVIASSGTISVTTVTNSTFVNTNVFISTSNAFFNLVYVTNLYSDTITNNTFVNTNTVIITGKASVNTLIVTNVAIYGNLTNTVATASTVAAYDANKLLTNLANAHGVLTNTASGPASFGLLQNTELANSSLTIAGTANQVAVSGGGPVALGGTATLSLPSPILTPGAVQVTGLTNTSATILEGVETNTTMGTGVIHSDLHGSRSSSAVIDGDISGTLTKNTTGASGSTTNYWDTNSISLAFSWTGPSNTVPVDQGYHFYTTTTGFSFTNMVAVSGSNLWSTVVVSNQLSTSVTGYCTIPGIRIYGVPSVGSASNAVIVPGGKTLVASFWSVSTLITNAAIAAQSN